MLLTFLTGKWVQAQVHDSACSAGLMHGSLLVGLAVRWQHDPNI